MTGDPFVATRWWWVRHAPVAAAPGVIAGQLDLPADLSDRDGLAALAPRLPADAVWLVTPLRRTRETAQALLALRGDGAAPAPALVAEPELMEQHFGAWQGRTHADLSGEPGVDRFWEAPARAAPPGGESFAAVADRVGRAVDRLSALHAGRDIVAVAHAGAIRAAVGHALSLTPESMLALCADCLHLSRLDRVAGTWRVVAVNLPPR